MRRILLACGVLGSLVYVAADVLAALRYPDYHSFTSRVISELMASGAPTERLVDPVFLLYDALVIAFALGVWMSGRDRRTHIAAASLFAVGALGLLGPTVAEMNLRGSGGPRSADVVHVALTAVLMIFIVTAVAVGGSSRGRVLRIYSYATLVVMIAFGALTSLAIQGIDAGEATPWVGLLERVNIGAFLLWHAVYAIALARAPATSASRATSLEPAMSA